MDGRMIKGHETREKIMHEALLIVSKEGINGLTAKKLADRSGVSKSNIFHHFKSVNHLLVLILNSLVECTASQLDSEQIDSLEDFFQVLGASTFLLKGDELAIYRGLFSYYHETLYNTDYKELILQVKQGVMDHIHQVLNQVAGKDIPAELVEMIVIDLDGYGMHYLIEMDSDKYMKLWNVKTSMYIKAIKNFEG